MTRRIPPQFPGFSQPSIDFAAVRDSRRAVPFYLPVDLSVARSIAAGTQLVVPIAGNSFYSDPLVDGAGAAIGGVAVVHFQDTNLNPAGTPFTVAPQFIARVPFTQLLIENPAQAGKSARFIYGVDVDFTPGINAQVSITGIVSGQDVGTPYGVKFTSTATINLGATELVLAAGSNLAGVRVVRGAGYNSNTGGPTVGQALHAHTGAPAAITDGDILLLEAEHELYAAAFFSKAAALNQPLQIVAGKGLWWRNSTGVNLAGVRHLLYTIN